MPIPVMRHRQSAQKSRPIFDARPRASASLVPSCPFAELDHAMPVLIGSVSVRQLVLSIDISMLPPTKRRIVPGIGH